MPAQKKGYLPAGNPPRDRGVLPAGRRCRYGLLFTTRRAPPILMKTLYLMRHAKSDQDYVDLADRDRPLAERGRRDAPFMAQQLLAREVSPLDLIICSPAVRTLSTATLVAKELDYDPLKIQVEDALYEADREAYLDIISQLKPSLEEVLIVGHNNTITDVANFLSPQFVPELPTAGLVCLRFDTLSWKNLARDSAEFGFFDFPKNYDL